MFLDSKYICYHPLIYFLFRSSDQSLLPATSTNNAVSSDPTFGAPEVEDKDPSNCDSKSGSSSDEDTEEESGFDDGEESEDRDDMLDEGWVTGPSHTSKIGLTRELDATVIYTIVVAGGIENNLTNSDEVVAPAAVVAEQVNTDPQIGGCAPYLIYTSLYSILIIFLQKQLQVNTYSP